MILCCSILVRGRIKGDGRRNLAIWRGGEGPEGKKNIHGKPVGKDGLSVSRELGSLTLVLLQKWGKQSCVTFFENERKGYLRGTQTDRMVRQIMGGGAEG